MPHPHSTLPAATATHLAVPRPERSCRLIEWRPWPQANDFLIGHAAVAFAGGWVVHKIPIFRRADGSLSVGVPDTALIDGSGRIKLRDGKKQYSALLTFETTEARERWRRMVLTALAAAGITGADAAIDSTSDPDAA